ncbi:MAG: helix-turn-helix transcriptional regulator [Polaromonas sp.]|nr:helix-turn-helix transcriptional regulator [Polaromonas sp.]
MSPRELACLRLAFEGLTARESGEALLCSERTVNFHLAHTMSKLKVDNKLAAVQRACWFGLIGSAPRAHLPQILSCSAGSRQENLFIIQRNDLFST